MLTQFIDFLNHHDVSHICTPLVFIREDKDMPISVSATAHNAFHRKVSHSPTIASPPLSVTRVICAHESRQQLLPMLQLLLPPPLLC